MYVFDLTLSNTKNKTVLNQTTDNDNQSYYHYLLVEISSC